MNLPISSWSRIPLFKVSMSEESVSLVNKVLISGYIGQGELVDKFESKLREYTDANYIATTNSGTSALHLALHIVRGDAPKVLHPPLRDEVLTIPLTCTATTFPILANGLKLRWVDTDPSTCNIDVGDLRRKINGNTLAIMLVHWGGNPCDLDAINHVLDDSERMYGYRPPVIEDCAHAFGATYNDEMLGNHGNYCCFSFQAIKHLTAGDGGMLVCPNAASHTKAVMLRWYGLDRSNSVDMRCLQNIHDWGYKFHMNDINAAIGLGNLGGIDGVLAAHRDNGAYYNDALKSIDGLRLLEYNSGCSYWVYTIRVRDRDAFVKHMHDGGVVASRVHNRNDKHHCVSAYRSLLPGTDDICSDMICIPCGWWVSKDHREYIVDLIKKGW